MSFGQISSSFASRNMDEQLELKIVEIAEDDGRPYICSPVGRSATVCEVELTLAVVGSSRKDSDGPTIRGSVAV
jgi:hypothetical protein